MTQLIWPTAAQAVAHAVRRAKAPLVWDPASHLLSRFAFGPTPSTHDWVSAHGPDAFLSSQLSFARSHLGYGAHAKVAGLGPLLAKTPDQVAAWYAARGGAARWDLSNQLSQVTIGLQTWSPAQLYETLVDFFANHLNVANHSFASWNTRHTMDRDVVRKYALGSFTDMLLASARNPAMLAFLSLASSTKVSVNENYARELLELHTVGRRYSESDVKNAAKLLTGRTFDASHRYVYNGTIHATGAVKVLGFQHANSSETDGQAASDELLRYLARHPYTASNLARKICVRFVSDNPSPALVDAVAKAYLRDETSIVSMVTTILHSTEFWESRGLKTRRPAENVIATLRQISPTITDYDKTTWLTYNTLRGMGNSPLDWAAPNGYPDTAADWRSSGTLLNEWNFQLGICEGWWSKAWGIGSANVTTMYASAKTSGQAVAMLAKRLTNTTFTSAELSVIQRVVGEPASTPIAKSRLKWMHAQIAGLILHAPQHAFR